MGTNSADIVVDKTLKDTVKGFMLDLVWNGKASESSTMVIKSLKKPNLNKILECAKAHPESWRVVVVTQDNIKNVKKTNGFNIAKVGDIVSYFIPELNLRKVSSGLTSTVTVSPKKIKLLVHKDTKKHGRFLIG